MVHLWAEEIFFWRMIYSLIEERTVEMRRFGGVSGCFLTDFCNKNNMLQAYCSYGKSLPINFNIKIKNSFTFKTKYVYTVHIFYKCYKVYTTLIVYTLNFSYRKRRLQFNKFRKAFFIHLQTINCLKHKTY